MWHVVKCGLNHNGNLVDDIDVALHSVNLFIPLNSITHSDKRDILERLTPYKLNACTNLLPSPASCQSSRWETGTSSFEAIAGIEASILYMASISVRAGLCSAADSLR